MGEKMVVVFWSSKVWLSLTTKMIDQKCLHQCQYANTKMAFYSKDPAVLARAAARSYLKLS